MSQHHAVSSIGRCAHSSILPVGRSPKLRLSVLALLLFTICHHTAVAQDRLLPVFHFERLTTANGLPTDEIPSKVMRDSRGFMWIGTEDGLARFDGYSCQVYRNDPADAGSLSSNDAQMLHVDRRGLLWVGTLTTGLSLYNPDHDRFVNFLPRDHDSTRFHTKTFGYLHEDRTGNLWCGSAEGEVVRVDLSAVPEGMDPDSIAGRIRFRTFQGFKNTIWDICDWDNGTVLVASENGLFAVDPETGSLKRPGFPAISGIHLDTAKVSCLCWETPQKLWLGTRNQGLYLYDRATGSLLAYHKRAAGARPRRDDYIMDAVFDKAGRFWVATRSGLDLFNPSSGLYEEYLTTSTDHFGEVTFVTVDDKGVLWVTTSVNGIFFLSPKSFRFGHYGFRGAGSAPTMMESIFEGNDGSLWIRTEGRMIRVQPENLNITQNVELHKGQKNKYGGWDGSYVDAQGRIWHGSLGMGMYSFEPGSGRVFNFRPSHHINLSHNLDFCLNMTGGGDGSLWVAAHKDGLLQFDTRVNTFSDRSELFGPRLANVVDVADDDAGNLWVADQVFGLFRFNPPTKRFDRFVHNADQTNTLSDNDLVSVFQDPRGRMWVGARALNLWDPEDRGFKRFWNEGFRGGRSAIPRLSDRTGKLWVWYEGKGLGILDPTTAKFANYDGTDGLAGGYEMAQLHDGRVAMVGSSGMNIVDPDSLYEAQPPPPFTLTKVLVSDTEWVSFRRITAASGLQLPHNSNVIEFEFAAIDPGAMHLIEYSYRLEGLEDDWINSNGRRPVRYPGLNPGDYVFRAKAVNKLGRWPDQEIALAISIAPPWWGTWWFRVLAIACVVGLTGFVYRREVGRLRRDKSIQQEFSRQQIESQEVERKRLAAELHDGLGQDLLVVSNELQQFLQEGNGSKEDLRQAATLVQESIQSVREISSNLHPHHLDRLGFSAALEAMTENLSRSSGLIIHRSCDNIGHVLSKETEIHLYRIIQEALSNVVRHASAKSAKVNVKKDEHSVDLTVSDDGKGFDANAELERKPSHAPGDGLHGFGLSSMAERVRIVGGTMKIESTPGSGTTVQVSLPIS